MKSCEICFDFFFQTEENPVCVTTHEPGECCHCGWKSVYTPCKDPACTHFWVQHESGGYVDIIYTKESGITTAPRPQVWTEPGCQNIGCPCKEFKE